MNIDPDLQTTTRHIWLGCHVRAFVEPCDVVWKCQAQCMQCCGASFLLLTWLEKAGGISVLRDFCEYRLPIWWCDAGMWRHCFTKLHIVIHHDPWIDAITSAAAGVPRVIFCGIAADGIFYGVTFLPTTLNVMKFRQHSIHFFWIAITISLWMVARAPGKTCALWVRMSMGERGKCRQHSIHFFWIAMPNSLWST